MITNTKQKKKFIIYTRCSTDDQARGDYTTLDAQTHHCGNMLEALGYESVGVIRDDGYSGKDLNRPGIQSVLNQIGLQNNKPNFDGIVFFRLDRLTRNPKDFYSLMDLFKENEIDFISVRENLDSSSALGRALIGILITFNAFEREQTGERVKASSIARATQGKWPGGGLPYGYKLINNGDPLPNGRQPHKIVVNPDIGPKLRMIWELAAQNKSLLYIGKELEKQNIISPTGKMWRKQSIHAIIRNPFYKGFFNWAGKLFQGYHDPLIEADIWEKANKMISSHLPGHRFIKTPKEYIYLLEGLLRCGNCGSKFIANFARGHAGRKFFYYDCSRSKMGLGCDADRISAKGFDHALIDYFQRSSEDRQIIMRAIGEAIEQAKEQLKEVHRDIVAIEEKLKTAKEQAEKLIDLALNGMITQGNTYKDRLFKLESDILFCEQELSRLRLREKTAEMSKNSGEFAHSNIVYAISQINDIDPQMQKNLIQSLIKEIIIYKDHIEVIMFIGEPLQKPCTPMAAPNKKCPSAISEEALTPAGGLAERPTKCA